jgi:outer membrane receptor protein involved in Fe transport
MSATPHLPVTPRSLLIAGLSMASAGLGWSQAVAPKPPAEEAVVMSPFVVDAAEDSGYQASATLSGSRLRTELRDVASSVTVLTSEFLDDLGVTNLESAMALVAGAENDSTTDFTGLNSLAQGYVGGDFGDTNTRDNNVRVRGLGSASTTANFFEQYSSADTYNADRGEVLRGANSILFGLGNPGGIINQSTKVAHLQKNLLQVSSKIDNFGSTRTVLDVSRVLLKDRLAVRAVGLYSDRRYSVDNTYWRDNRIFATATYKPFAGTRVQAFVERVLASGRRPNYRTSQDNVSDWLTAYNRYAPLMTPAQIESVFYWDPAARTGAPALSNNITLTNGEVVSLGQIRRQQDGNANGTVAFFDGSNWASPQGGGATLFSNRTTTGGAGNRFFARSGSPLENRAGYVDPQVINPSILPFEDIEVGSLPGNFRWERNDKVNVSIEQRVTRDLFVMAAVQHEWMKNDQTFSPIAQTQSINIDINTRLPDGSANPNFLRPYVFGRSIGGHADYKRRNMLVQASYVFDFEKTLPKLGWLGYHRIGALFTQTERDELNYRFNWQIDNTLAGVLPTAATAASRHIYQLWYIGDPVKVGDQGLRLTGFPTRTDNIFGADLPYRYFNQATNSWQASPTPVHIGRQVIANGRTLTRTENSGGSLTLQSYFWKRRLVALLGLRRDEVDFYRHEFDATLDPLVGAFRGDYTAPSAPTYSNTRSTSTKSLVFHVTDWLRVFGSRSENFAATAPRTDNLWRPIDPQNGATDEVGVGLALFRGKLNLKVSAFEGANALADHGPTSSIATLRVEAIEDQLYNALQAAGRLSEWSTIGTDGNRTTGEYTRPNNVAATASVRSKGIEMEMVCNPTPEWRLAFSVSTLDNTNSDVGLELVDFLNARADFYRKYWQENLRVDGTNDSLPNNTATSIRNNFRTVIATPLLSAQALQGTANRGTAKYHSKLVTSYTFRRGPLKGFSFGGNARLEQEKIVGYGPRAVTLSIGGLDGIAGEISDPDQPYYRDRIVAGGAFVGYARKIYNGRVGWRVQLHAQNLFSEHGLRVINLNPDRSEVWGIAPPRIFELTNTFDF